LNGIKLSGSPVTQLEDAIVNVDTAKSSELVEDERSWFESALLKLTRNTYRVRALGVGALASCRLATGALDAFVDLTGYDKPQDVAAGRVILMKSGNKVDYVEFPVGPPRLVAAPPALWPDLVDLLYGCH
jgi:fructose-1,6-bisphosphatase/inositol monophosphatase family enzyme